MNGHFELAAELLDAGADPNADRPGYTALHAITVVRKPGIGDNDPAPEGSGNMTQPRVRQAARRARRERERAHDATGEPDEHAPATKSARPRFCWPRITADAELMKALVALGADPLLTNDDKHHGADGRRRARHAIARRRRRHGGRSARSRAGGARSRRRHQCRRQQRRDRHARRGLQEPAQGREVPRGQGRQDRRLEPEEQVRMDAADHRARDTDSATSSRRRIPRPRCGK